MGREADIHIQLLYGGISAQPAHVRHESQVEDAVNADFSFVDGMSKRRGSNFIKKITSLTASGNYRLHPITRDQTEQYIVLYGDSTIRIFTLAGVEATVNISAEAQAYIDENDATADELRLVSIADYTFLANTTVEVGTKTSDSYEVDATHNSYDVLTCKHPTALTYHSTKDATATETAGYWQYTVTDANNGFAYWTSAAMGANWNHVIPASSGWSNVGNNPQGFNVGFRRLALTVTDGDWVETTKTLTPVTTGEFAGYTASTAEDADQIYVSGGTGITAGWYGIASNTDDAIVLTESPSTGGTDLSNHNIAATGIGREFKVRVNNYIDQPVDMHDVALKLTQALRRAGATNACIYYSDENPYNGKMHIVSPWRGSNASVLTLSAPTPDNVYNLTAATVPFNGGTNTAGTGSPTTLTEAIADRWQRVPAPAQADAELDETTMPIQIVRTATSPLTFSADVIDWSFRKTGDKATNPVLPLWENGVTLADISFHRNRLVLAGDRYVVFSAAGDYFNFYLDDDENMADSDPFDVLLSSNEVTLVDFVTPFNKSLVVFTKAGRQFELNAPETFTLGTVAITESTDYETLSIRPQPMGNVTYFAGQEKDAAVVYEYYYNDSRVSNTAANVTAHFSGVLPTSLRTIQTSGTHNLVVVLPTSGTMHDSTVGFYVYRSFWVNNNKEQSAWTRYSFDDSYRICDLAVVGNDAYLLVESDSQFILERMPLIDDTIKSGWPDVIHLDRKVETTGSTVSTKTQWELGFDDTTIDTVVLGPDFDEPGTEVAVTAVTGDDSKVEATGDYTDGEVMAGRSYEMQTEFSRPYYRDMNGVPDVSAWLQVRQFTANHKDSGSYTLEATYPSRTTRSKSFTTSTTDSRGSTRAWFGGKAEDLGLFVSSQNAKPVTITSIDYVVEYEKRRG